MCGVLSVRGWGAGRRRCRTSRQGGPARPPRRPPPSRPRSSPGQPLDDMIRVMGHRSRRRARSRSRGEWAWRSFGVGGAEKGIWRARAPPETKGFPHKHIATFRTPRSRSNLVRCEPDCGARGRRTHHPGARRRRIRRPDFRKIGSTTGAWSGGPNPGRTDGVPASRQCAGADLFRISREDGTARRDASRRAASDRSVEKPSGHGLVIQKLYEPLPLYDSTDQR